MIRSVMFAIATAALLASSLLGPARAQDTRLRTGGSSARIVAADGYDAAIFARRLGHVSALTRHEDGTLYTADSDGGRIFRISDRRMDGASDITQALPHRFDRPSGLAIAGDTLFVADQGGIWRVSPGGGTPELLAPFANTNASSDGHPIMMIAPTSVLLGLNRTDGTAQLLVIDAQSGAATLRESGQGRIIGFASTAAADTMSAPWILLRRGGTTLFGSSLASARAIDVPVQAVWIDEPNALARIALPDGVYETVATFAGLTNKGTLIMSGFEGDAQPGVMMSDARGLFIADQAGGRLWRLSETPDVVATPDIALPDPAQDIIEETPPARDLTTRPALMRGSGIGSASAIGPASTMPNASTIPEADQPRAASDPNE